MLGFPFCCCCGWLLPTFFTCYSKSKCGECVLAVSLLLSPWMSEWIATKKKFIWRRQQDARTVRLCAARTMTTVCRWFSWFVWWMGAVCLVFVVWVIVSTSFGILFCPMHTMPMLLSLSYASRGSGLHIQQRIVCVCLLLKACVRLLCLCSYLYCIYVAFIHGMMGWTFTLYISCGYTSEDIPFIVRTSIHRRLCVLNIYALSVRFQ